MRVHRIKSRGLWVARQGLNPRYRDFVALIQPSLFVPVFREIVLQELSTTLKYNVLIINILYFKHYTPEQKLTLA